MPLHELALERYFFILLSQNAVSQKNAFENYEIYSVSLYAKNESTYLNENYLTMPYTVTFTLEKSARALAVLADITGAIMFLNFTTGWTMNDVLCNPISKALIFAVLVTTFIFIAPPEYRKAKKKTTAIVILSSISVFIILLFIFFPKGDCATKSAIPLLPVPVNNDTIKSNPIIQKKENGTIKKSAPIYRDKKDKISLRKNDTALTKTSKYNLDKPVFNGPTQVGDGNTMNVNKGLKQRSLTMIELKDIVNRIPDKNTIIQMGLYNEAGKEGENYASQIANSLIANGYKRVQNGITQISLFSNSATNKNFDVSRTQGDDSTVMIAIYPAKNIE